MYILPIPVSRMSLCLCFSHSSPLYTTPILASILFLMYHIEGLMFLCLCKQEGDRRNMCFEHECQFNTNLFSEYQKRTCSCVCAFEVGPAWNPKRDQKKQCSSLVDFFVKRRACWPDSDDFIMTLLMYIVLPLFVFLPSILYFVFVCSFLPDFLSRHVSLCLRVYHARFIFGMVHKIMHYI
jgi:hypothetical protein